MFDARCGIQTTDGRRCTRDFDHAGDCVCDVVVPKPKPSADAPPARDGLDKMIETGKRLTEIVRGPERDSRDRQVIAKLEKALDCFYLDDPRQLYEGRLLIREAIALLRREGKD